MVAPVITLLLWQQKRLSAKRATALSAWIAGDDISDCTCIGDHSKRSKYRAIE